MNKYRQRNILALRQLTSEHALIDDASSCEQDGVHVHDGARSRYLYDVSRYELSG